MTGAFGGTTLGGSLLYQHLLTICQFSKRSSVGIAEGYLYDDIPINMHYLDQPINHPKSCIQF
jgi:hypothetical protein